MLTRAAAVLGVAVLTLAAASCSARNTTDTAAPGCPETAQKYCSAQVGDLLEVTLKELRPTQPSLGFDEVYYRLGRYTLGADAANQLLDQWCATNGQKELGSAQPGATVADPGTFTCSVPLGKETDEDKVAMKTVVIGPGGQPYLTDGHHTLTSFWEAPGGGPDTRVRLKVTGNLATTAPDAFWAEMQNRGWTWLRDVDGSPITPDALPISLGLKQFANDQYRGAMYFVRDVGYRQDDNSPAFQEFYWGQWLRSQTDPGLAPANFALTEVPAYLTLVGNIGKAIVALPGTAQIADGQDAGQLGRLDTFGEKAFAALSEPLDSAKPGKLTYAMAYKAKR